MIFVILGTQKQQFKRIIDYVLTSVELLDEEIVVQAGYTKYESENENFKLFTFMSSEDFESNILKADIIITHGGVGSIFSALEKNKKIIAVPRLEKYSEHVDDHQLEICNKLALDNYILYFNEEKDDFNDLVISCKEKNFKKYTKPNFKYEEIENFIESL